VCQAVFNYAGIVAVANFKISDHLNKAFFYYRQIIVVHRKAKILFLLFKVTEAFFCRFSRIFGGEINPT
jgi:hypothetical protein